MSETWKPTSGCIDYLMTVKSSDSNVYLSLLKQCDKYCIAYNDLLMKKTHKLQYNDLEEALRQFYISAMVI